MNQHRQIIIDSPDKHCAELHSESNFGYTLTHVF